MRSIVRNIVLTVVVGTALAFLPQRFDSAAWVVQSAAAAGLSQDEAARRAREQTGGRVLSIESESNGGGQVYLVKVLLPNGTVRVVKIGR